jgi:type I restriction-modification system DNA methylase subunit
MKTIKDIITILKLDNITGLDLSRHIGNLLMLKYLTVDKCNLLGINTKYAYENFYIENNNNDHDKAIIKFWHPSEECFISVTHKLLNFKNTNFEFKVKTGINFGLIYSKLNELQINKKIYDKCYIDKTMLLINKNSKDILEKYTDSGLCNFMVKLCKPVMKNKNDIESILDPFCGTGGFLVKSVNYLDDNNNNINWETNKNRIYGIDIDPIFRNKTIFKLLFNTDKLFTNTIGCNDTLHNDYKINDNTMIDKVDIILSHMPYGLKNIIYKNVCKRIKELKMDGTKAEPLILQLMMKSLNPHGRCCVIVPDNLLLNDAKLHKQTRTYLVENLNVKKIISIDEDILNMGVKSSILYFINNGKTEEIEYSEIHFKNKEESEIIETPLMTITYDEIVQNEYSLYINKYNNKKVVLIDEIKYEKLGNLFDIRTGSKLKKDDIIDINDNQKIKYYGYNGTEQSYVTKSYNYSENTLIISKLKNNNELSKIVNNKFWLNENGYALIKLDKAKDLHLKFINYYLLSRNEELYNCYNSKGILSIDILKDLMIPMSSLETQSKVISIVDLFNRKIEENKKLIKTSVDMQKNLIWLNLLNNVEDEDKLKNVISIEPGAVIPTTPSKNNDLSYRVYGGNVDNVFTHKYNRDNKIIISKFDENTNIKYIKTQFYLNQNGWSINVINSKYMEEYVYIWLWYNQQSIFMGSTNILHQTNFLNLKIANVSIDLQKKIIREFNYHQKIIDLLQHDILHTNKYQSINQILNSYKDTNSHHTASDQLEEDDIAINYITKDLDQSEDD